MIVIVVNVFDGFAIAPIKASLDDLPLPITPHQRGIRVPHHGKIGSGHSLLPKPIANLRSDAQLYIYPLALQAATFIE
jgi:hypothetical protein